MNHSHHPHLTALKFAKQFLVAPPGFTHELIARWRCTPLEPSLKLHSHPNLHLASAHSENGTLHGLGTFLDPNHPESSETEILAALIASSPSFGALESSLAHLGGRWVLIAGIGSQSRIYHDATGLKPIFLYLASPSAFYAASQPSLLHALGLTERDEDLVRAFEVQKNSGSWPINVVPYPNTKQVAPNHYLSLNDGSINRYWPTNDLPNRSSEEAAELMLPILGGLISAANARSKCVMNLTGGYDSRLLLAAAKSFRNNTEFFTVKRADSPHHDISVPKKLRSRFRLNHKFINPEQDFGPDVPDNQELVQALQQNVGGMYYDGSISASASMLASVGNKLHLPGLVSEVMRCFYYSDGVPPKRLDGKKIAHLAGFSGNEFAEQGFTEWCSYLPSSLPIESLDLLYWEHRLGVWASCGLSYREAVIDQIPPMNCRAFLEIGLSTGLNNRKTPYALIRELIRAAEPELVSLPFNRDWVDDWRDTLRKLPIPWRVKQRLKLV